MPKTSYSRRVAARFALVLVVYVVITTGGGFTRNLFETASFGRGIVLDCSLPFVFVYEYFMPRPTAVAICRTHPSLFCISDMVVLTDRLTFAWLGNSPPALAFRAAVSVLIFLPIIISYIVMCATALGSMLLEPYNEYRRYRKNRTPAQ